MLLAGDIGGTKTDLAVFDLEHDASTPVVQCEFPSGKYAGLAAIVDEFVRDTQSQVEWACFAVAGPVVRGEARITNLPWVLSERALQNDLGLRSVHLLNDLEAIAWAVPTLKSDNLRTLNVGSSIATGNIAVVAPGTGLGEAYLTWDGERYRAHASEGGHADFAPLDGRQAALLQHLWKKFDHVSYETVCSGIGIPNLYEFVLKSGHSTEVDDIAREIARASDRTPVIVSAAFGAPPRSELCREAVELFISILAAEAGNLAMKVLATGGVYLAGGLPLHVLPLVDDVSFMQTFARKGRFESLLTEVPVHIVLNRTALVGAARFAASVGSVSVAP